MSIILCIECGKNPPYKMDLLCEECRNKDLPKREGLKVCRCDCGYTCGRQCDLEFMECMKQHWKRDCEHQWDGEGAEWATMGGCYCSSTTCSKCGMTSIDHDSAVGP